MTDKIIIREVAVSFKPVRELKPQTIDSTELSANIIRSFIDGQTQEHFGILILDSRLQYRTWHTITIGTVDQTLIDPKDVFRVPIMMNAPRIILAHNHPSGDPSPSQADLIVTESIVRGGKLLGIEVLDHIIIGDDCYYSFREHPQCLHLK